ncbi:hypothetical protein AMTR_s00134p00075880 [Amborella trichopoda]|uniref:Uncharacterized protein n=1 Tax=Amborella trichopoda TaxID=13333 RepID=W1P5K3_AMBTC|nr:hypothetical protein AMTR_s00134p00075880 [Amborella trichopoda]
MKNASFLSYQAIFKNEDKTYLAMIKAVEEEMAKLQAYLNRLKTEWDQKRVEDQRKSQELERLNSEMASTSISSNQITQAISNFQEQMKTALEHSKTLETKICEALENF